MNDHTWTQLVITICWEDMENPNPNIACVTIGHSIRLS